MAFEVPSDAVQQELFRDPEVTVSENPDYLSRQLLTYIGNKRALLGPIDQAVQHAKNRLGRKRLRTFDVFSGSGIVSRFLKAHSSHIVTNDMESYAATISRCYMSNRSEINMPCLVEAVSDLNESVEKDAWRGFIEQLYAPKDENAIRHEDRVFYTKRNARRLDSYRRLIDAQSESLRDLLIAPLLYLASVHVNTSGVFKGFHKNPRTGIGQYGGGGSDALSRIKRTITLEVPVLSNFECEFQVLQGDANAVAGCVSGMDLAYIDPPYNQHPYGSNYFMLNLLDAYRRPECISRVSGIPTDWRRSGYNVRAKSVSLMRDLLGKIDSVFLLVSFNDEGFIHLEDVRSMLNALGEVTEFNVKYNTYRGCRNLRGRKVHVTEHLFLVERS